MTTLLEYTLTVVRDGPAHQPTRFVVRLESADGETHGHTLWPAGGAELDAVQRAAADLCGDVIIALGGLLDAEERAQRGEPMEPWQ